MMTFAAPYKNWRALYRVLGSRYREVSLLANARYLNALAVVDDPTEAKRDLDRVTTCKKDAAGRPCAGFNPMARHDSDLFRAVIDGEHWLKGFTNRDIRRKLEAAPPCSRHATRTRKTKAPRSAASCASSTLTDS
jgi:hypothetical protein